MNDAVQIEKEPGWRFAPGPNEGDGVAYLIDERSGAGFAFMAGGDNVVPAILKRAMRGCVLVAALSELPGLRPMTDAEIDDFQERHARVCDPPRGAP